MRALEAYKRKRNFSETNEPKGQWRPTRLPIFVVQRHAATRLHFDFRLQVKGTLASWAVPEGPPEEIGEKRLAIHVEDHPIEYAKFEGDIPAGSYGAGHVDIWDEGTFEVEGPESAATQIERGDLKFRLTGNRLNGRFVLVKMKNRKRGNEWLFIRKSRSNDSGTFERSVSKRRRGTVLIDAIQNAKGKPLATPYSLRPFVGAPVSTPVTEAELARGLKPENLNVTTIFKRLKTSGDLWKSFWDAAQFLDVAVAKAT
jgi:bifunctional non-homologous end joining protein LigD